MNAKDYLKQIKKIDTQIKNKGVELEQAEKLGLSTREIADEREKLQKEKSKIIKSIEKLPEAEYDVLHRIYVQYESLKTVAVEREISYSSATTIHGVALKRLEAVINADDC